MSDEKCPRCGIKMSEHPYACPGAEAPLAPAPGSASETYHLLDEGTEIQAADEGLSHDCLSWWRMDSHPSGKWMIGCEYTRNLFVPMRRKGPRPPDKIMRLVSPNKTDEPRDL